LNISNSSLQKNLGQALKPLKVLHHIPNALLSCWFILNPKKKAKFLAQQTKRKNNCISIVKSIHPQDKAKNFKQMQKQEPLQVTIQIEYLGR
jgi:hypothetical protein